MVAVRLAGLSKAYEPGVRVLDVIDLTIGSGEILTLLGPSGSGKTTLLRLVAGLDTPDVGRIRFDNRTVTRRPPDRREIGMVFQEHALFSHLSVGENVAVGLEARGVTRDEIAGRVGEGLEQVGLAGYELEMLGQRIVVRQPGGTLVAAPGERLRVAIPPERASLLE